jgi:hypothetical protein
LVGVDTIVATSHRLAVDDAGSRTQAGECLGDEREPACEVVAGAAIQLHFCAVFASDDAKAIVFDFVEPHTAGR